MKKGIGICLVMVLVCAAGGDARAQTCGNPPDVLILLDRSGSMSTDNKWNDAKTAINNLLTAHSGGIRFGLLLFPTSGTCNVNKLQVAPGPNTQAAIMSSLNSSTPSGKATPLSYALLVADNYLGSIDPGVTKYVMVISDGANSCTPADPVPPVQQLLNNGIKTYVVGFGSGVSPTQLNAMASAGGTALPGSTKYYSANNLTQLDTALQQIAATLTCCGNGVIDSGETCDTGITSGNGKCPTAADCNDNKACTADSVSGTGCDAKCVNTAITQPINNDGCCPPGATSVTDNDCAVVCGNGLKEPGEDCDTAITSGPGKCPTASDCNDGDPCTADAISGSGCNAKCSNTPLTANPTTADGCCPAGATSATDKDCAPGCGNGTLDSGETCDPAIASGTGKCPTAADCNDGKACTADGVSGSSCQRTCTNTPISANASTKDGCCPSGANAITDADCQPVCGNGVLEPGEACDSAITSGAGSCPSACNDNNACTTDKLGGSGCSARCTFTAKQPSLSAKDGCCPPGATAATDADCTASCGNGVLEPGETCDPKITSGFGVCPTKATCDDNDPCTVDLLVGGACKLSCGHTPAVASLSAKDNCCPPGATYATDLDCSATCGNGVVDPGETCDTAITSGAGRCKKAEDCKDADPCIDGRLSGSGCTAKCVLAKRGAHPEDKDGCCPAGHTRETDADCLPPCDPDQTTNCIDVCKGVKCPSGNYCQKGKCVPFPDNPNGPGLDGGAGSGDGSGNGNGFDAKEGCSCDVGAAGGGGTLLLVLLLLGCVLASRRRRR